MQDCTSKGEEKKGTRKLKIVNLTVKKNTCKNNKYHKNGNQVK